MHIFGCWLALLADHGDEHKYDRSTSSHQGVIVVICCNNLGLHKKNCKWFFWFCLKGICSSNHRCKPGENIGGGTGWGGDGSGVIIICRKCLQMPSLFPVWLSQRCAVGLWSAIMDHREATVSTEQSCQCVAAMWPFW